MPFANSLPDSSAPPAQQNGHKADEPRIQNQWPESESLIPAEQLPLPELCSRINAAVQDFLNETPHTEQMRSVQEQTRISLGVIRETLERYGLSYVSLAYNGGKDCLVLLILFLCALSSHPSLSTPNPPPIQTVYIVSKHPFPEVEDFVQSTSKTYSLSLTRYDSPMKVAFTEYLNEKPGVKAIFVGTRRTDPHGANLTFFDETDHGWPSFMRVHPVIDWHYVDIWAFIRHLKIPYCPLYDKGYTSLGGTTDTHPNPALRRESVSRSGKPQIDFRPAYELMEDGEERLGRDRDWKPTAGSGKMLGVKDGGVDSDVAVIDDDESECEQSSGL